MGKDELRGKYSCVPTIPVVPGKLSRVKSIGFNWLTAECGADAGRRQEREESRNGTGMSCIFLLCSRGRERRKEELMNGIEM